MKRLWIGMFLVGLITVFSAGCVARKPIAEFSPVDLNAKVRSGDYTKNVDNFLVVLDASGSMSESVGGREKLAIAKDVVERLNRTIPDMGFIAGIRTFGNTFIPFIRKTDRIYGMTALDKDDFSKALDTVRWAGGLSPMVKAANAVPKDLNGLSGKTALIFISDAKDMDAGETIAAVHSIKDQMGGNICIYTILVGNDSAGRAMMQKMAGIGGCGFATDADRILSPQAMADYVEKVFLAKAKPPMDSDGDGVIDAKDQCPNTPAGVAVDSVGCPKDTDGDGVYDYQDRCPGTPAGVAVDRSGCPLDSDRDGVPDYLDKCPNTPPGIKVDAHGCPFPLDSDGDGVIDAKDRCPGTPTGAKVDSHGCWVLSGVLFDSGKASIKPAMAKDLEQVAKVMRSNPGLNIEIQGYTDSVGNNAYNQALSEKRAKAVMNHLIKIGISPKRLTAKGFGESRPVATNATAEGRAQNRRVELKPLR